MISVTRPDVLLSCEAAVGKQISYILPTLIAPSWWAFVFLVNLQYHLFLSFSFYFMSIQDTYWGKAMPVLCQSVWVYFPVETFQKWPQCCSLRARGAGLLVWLTLSLSDSAGRWKMVSINSSEQHGWLCREESWGRGNGSMQEERSAWLWLPAATIPPHCYSWCCSPLMDWVTVHPPATKEPCGASLVDGVVLCRGSVWRGLLHSISVRCTVTTVFWSTSALSPRLVRLKECAALIKDV